MKQVSKSFFSAQQRRIAMMKKTIVAKTKTVAKLEARLKTLKVVDKRANNKRPKGSKNKNKKRK